MLSHDTIVSARTFPGAAFACLRSFPGFVAVGADQAGIATAGGFVPVARATDSPGSRPWSPPV